MTPPDPADYPHRAMVLGDDVDAATVIAWFNVTPAALDFGLSASLVRTFMQGGHALLMARTAEALDAAQAAVAELAAGLVAQDEPAPRRIH